MELVLSSSCSSMNSSSWSKNNKHRERKGRSGGPETFKDACCGIGQFDGICHRQVYHTRCIIHVLSVYACSYHFIPLRRCNGILEKLALGTTSFLLTSAALGRKGHSVHRDSRPHTLTLGDRYIHCYKHYNMQS